MKTIQQLMQRGAWFAALALSACGGGGGSGGGTDDVSVADVDGDGRADLVAANAGNAPSGGSDGASASVLRQTSPGSFVSSCCPEFALIGPLG